MTKLLQMLEFIVAIMKTAIYTIQAILFHRIYRIHLAILNLVKVFGNKTHQQLNLRNGKFRSVHITFLIKRENLKMLSI